MTSDTRHIAVDIGDQASGSRILGIVLALLIGVLVLLGVFTGEFEGGRRVAGAILGGSFTLIALVSLLRWRTLTRPRRLIFDRSGVRMDDPDSRSWSIGWHELRAVAIAQRTERFRSPFAVAFDWLADTVAPRAGVGRLTFLHLDLYPSDPDVHLRHLEMEHLWELGRMREGYRLPLANNRSVIGPIEQAIRLFQPQSYLGVRNDGFISGDFLDVGSQLGE